MTVTVVRDLQVHGFSDAEMDTILSALSVASSHYQVLAEMQKLSRELRDEFANQARTAADLRLSIEAAR